MGRVRDRESLVARQVDVACASGWVTRPLTFGSGRWGKKGKKRHGGGGGVLKEGVRTSGADSRYATGDDSSARLLPLQIRSAMATPRVSYTPNFGSGRIRPLVAHRLPPGRAPPYAPTGRSHRSAEDATYTLPRTAMQVVTPRPGTALPSRDGRRMALRRLTPRYVVKLDERKVYLSLTQVGLRNGPG